MLSFQKLAVVFLLFCKLNSVYSQSPTYPVKVYPNGYTGHLAISGSTSFFSLHADTTLAINPDADGKYSLNTGATIGDWNPAPTSYIYIFFDNEGRIDSLTPKGSATVGQDQKSIQLNTTSITINPGKFNRHWTLSSTLRSNYYSGKTTIQLIKGISYSINQADAVLSLNCRCDPANNILKRDAYYGSFFYFTVKQDGQVSLYDKNHFSAKALGNTLLFKTICLSIDPAVISGGIPLEIYDGTSQILIPKKKKLPFIRGTVSFVHWIDKTIIPPKDPNKYFHFLPL